ncbi:hypothetical protein [Nocardia sp. bgisy118]|uniref:hypothetical protein n=1 Tax=Nocardia sp. bgisy118 TaxID=3413786 RepID=UPI003F4A348C
MTMIRLLLGAAGLWLGWHGFSQLLDFPRADLISIAWWFAAAIVLHDGVFAPLCAAAGLTARRLLPAWSWAPVVVGAVCTVTLGLLAVAVLGREHANAANPTVLDRDYSTGLLTAVVVIWALVAVAALWRRRIRR